MTRKRILILLGSVCLALMLALPMVASCAAPTPTPTPTPAPTPPPTPTPTPPPTPTATMEPQKWLYLITSVTTENWTWACAVEAMERIKERTDGFLDIEVVPRGVLPIKAEDWIPAISEGTVQMIALHQYQEAALPFFSIRDISGLMEGEVERIRVYYETFPIYERELNKENIHQLAYHVFGLNQLMCLNEPVDDIADLGRLKIRSYGMECSQRIEAMNGVPVTISLSEVFTSLQKGVVDGVVTSIAACWGGKYHEIAPYGYYTPFSSPIYTMVVNKTLWEALPEDVREIAEQEFNRMELITLAGNEDVTMWYIEDMLRTGLESYTPEISDTLRSNISELVATPMLKTLLGKSPTIGEEILVAMERALGRTLPR